MSDLKPCPACGEKEALHLTRFDQVKCYVCGLIGPEDDPVGWNALPRREDMDAELRELRAYRRAWERLEAMGADEPPFTATTAYNVVVTVRGILAEELAKGGG